MLTKLALVGLLALGLAGTASAQSANWSFSGAYRPPTYHIIDPALANTPIAAPQPLTGRTSFSLTNFFPKFSTITNAHVFGSSNFPTPKQMPGPDYLKAFTSGIGLQ